MADPPYGSSNFQSLWLEVLPGFAASRDGLATVRLYLVRGRLYVLVGIGPEGSQSGAGDPAPPPEVAVFLDSFRLSA